MSSVENVVEFSGQQEVPAVSVGLPDIVVEPVSEKPESDIDAPEKVGWEYDEFVNAYKDHPRNRLRVRYARDCEGFDVGALKPFDSVVASSSDEDTKLFVAYMKQFPLIDNLQHQQLLKRRIDLGKDAHQALRSKDDLSPEEVRHLKRLAVDGAGSFLTMFECNLKLVMSIAGRQQESSSYSVGDAIGDGCLGLRRAIQKYDPEKGYKFSTYATNWIKQSIQRGHMPVAYGAAIPSGAYNDLREVIKERDRATEKGEKISDLELVEMGHKADDIRAVNLFFSLGRTSLDASLSSDANSTLTDVIVAPELNFEDSLFNEEHDRTLICSLIELGGVKDPRDLEILSLLEGIVLPGVDYTRMITIRGHDSATIGEYLMMIRRGELSIGRKDLIDTFGISIERIRQVHDKTRANILTNASLGSLSWQADFSEAYLEDLKAYVHFEKYEGEVEDAKDRKHKIQLRARNAIRTLRKIDLDFDDALFQTMRVIEDRFSYDKATVISIESWLSYRFGYVSEGAIPVTTREAKTRFDFNASRVEVVESIYLAILSGIWGKIPVESK